MDNIDVDSALKFKKSIDNLQSEYKCIGNSITEIEKFCYNYLGCMEDIEYDSGKMYQFYYRIDKFIKSLKYRSKKVNFINSCIDNYNIKINLQDESYDGCIHCVEDFIIENLYDNNKLQLSSYGDLNTMTTVQNTNVRKTFHIDSSNFELDPKLINCLCDYWKVYMTPNNVDIVPHKINVYDSSCFFKKHVDTPDVNMVGTMVYTIYGDPDRLVLYDQDKPITLDEIYNLVAFYSDVPHQVVKENGTRITITFKVYGKGFEDEIHRTNDKEYIIDSLVEEFKEMLEYYPFRGLILSHKYTLNSTCLKNNDIIIPQILKRLGYKYKLVPIAIENKCSSDFNGNYNEHDIHYNGRVYSLDKNLILPTFDDIKYNDDVPIQFHVPKGNVPFLNVNTDFIWKNDNENYIEHTGNEAQPGCIDMIYIQKAIIFDKLNKQKSARF